MGVDADMDLMKIVGDPDLVWGPTLGTTGDPDGLEPSEVPDDVPTSLPHDSSQCEGWKMSFEVVLPTTLG